MGAFESPYRNRVAGSGSIPLSFELYPNFPNPFNSSTKINYSLPYPTHVSLAVYDPLGRRVKTLLDGYRQAGVYSVALDGSDLTAGLYWVRLESGAESRSNKVVLVK